MSSFFDVFLFGNYFLVSIVFLILVALFMVEYKYQNKENKKNILFAIIFYIIAIFPFLIDVFDFASPGKIISLLNVYVGFGILVVFVFFILFFKHKFNKKYLFVIVIGALGQLIPDFFVKLFSEKIIFIFEFLFFYLFLFFAYLVAVDFRFKAGYIRGDNSE